MFCLQMNAAAFVQMNEEFVYWIRIGWYVGRQRYILDIFYGSLAEKLPIYERDRRLSNSRVK